MSASDAVARAADNSKSNGARAVKQSPADGHPSDVSQSGARSQQRKHFTSPKQLQLQSARQSSERFDRISELWGSPDGWGSSTVRDHLQGVSSSKSNVFDSTPVKKRVANYERPLSSKRSPAGNIRHMASPQTPSASSVSFIPHVVSPAVAIDVLKAAHAKMTVDMFNSCSSPNATDLARNISLKSKTALMLQGNQDHVASASASALHPPKNDQYVVPTFSPRRSEAILSSEELELKVRALQHCSLISIQMRSHSHVVIHSNAISLARRTALSLRTFRPSRLLARRVFTPRKLRDSTTL